MRFVRLLPTVCLFLGLSGCQTLSILSGQGTLSANENRSHNLTAGQLPAASARQGANPQAAAMPADLAASSTASPADLVTQMTGPVTKPSEQQALQQVMPDLQALLAEDPTAHAALLQEFGKTDPSLWAALTRRARSKIAYQNGIEVTSPQQSQVQLAAAQQQAGARAIVQQLAVQVTPANQSNVYSVQDANPLQANKSPSQILANQLATSSMTPQLNPSRTVPSEPIALPKPTANVTQVSHTSNSQTTNQVSHSNWIENPHADTSSQSNQSSATITINPYLPEPDNSASQASVGHEAMARVASMPSPKAPMPQMIENHTYESERTTDWRKSLNTAIDLMKANMPEQPASTEEAYRHARLRLLQLAAGKEGEAFESIPGLSSTEQSYWAKQIYSMATLLDLEQQVDRKRRASSAAIHQSAALAQLRKMGTLQIRNLSFCSEIYGFGAYEPIAQPKFLPGAEATLYTEIENYHSDSTDRGYHTLVATSYRVEDQSGSLVDEGEFPVVEDYCLSQRRDFHITYGVTLPTAIYPGEYYLKLTITDQLGDKIGEDSVPFEIVAP